ncbi:MAG: FIST domain containing protein [Methylomonas sp.]|nr:MAG: FIST domain containing protein [Methylomonas sp.]
MNNQSVIRTAHSCLSQPEQAIEQLVAELLQPDTVLVILFCSNTYDRAILAAEIKRRFTDVQVIGCTTAGEIGGKGLCQQSMVGVSFSGKVFTTVSCLMDNLQQFKMRDGHSAAKQLLQELQIKVPQLSPENCFGFLLIDGLSVREEPVTHAVQSELGHIAMIGGSAGDDMLFHNTHVLFNGDFYADSAILLLLHTTLPFKIFKTQHFEPTSERLVVTLADVGQRIVHEINGLPAAPEYARLIGVPLESLGPQHFAAAPVVVSIDSNYYVRSIRCVNDDGSLTFYCAIEEGLVLRVAKTVDPIDNLNKAFAEVRTEIGRPLLTLACDCVLRKYEIMQRGLDAQVEQIFFDNQVVGFNTYGEQFRGVHVNQTFAAVAIGSADRIHQHD